MAKNQLTETQALAKALARALSNEPKTFGATEAKIAIDTASALLGSGQVDAETFGRVIVRLGNHSALRQWAVSQGFISRDADALAVAVSEEIAMEKERLSDLAK